MTTALCRLSFKYREAYSLSTTFARHKSSKAAIEYTSDASGKGIGVVYNGKWLAWAFVQNCPDLPRSAKTGEINANYVELLAVELGLVHLIQDGVTSAKVTNFCDNRHIVHLVNSSLHAGAGSSKTKKKKQDGRMADVIRRIRGFVKEADIDLNATWIASKQNTADAPSRGKGLVDESRFLPHATVPHYLQKVVTAL
ncbi:hypothetical protein BKA70DRAFT_880917 [Coprinopsis sp. MPI-PUGE-AT-0042]|nr:hypothetical protein BKA70DRAFT_880917 [Coprinopsis sp. MPI-PUGE-AT-0042]